MRKRFAVGIAGMMFFSLSVTAPVEAADSVSNETYQQLNLFGDVFERVRADYVEEVSDTELIEAAINGMLSSLDPHSRYLNPKNFKEIQIQTRGEFGGLGIEVTMENGFVKVISPIDDTPADRAGVKAGDFVTHLDGEPVLGLSLEQSVERMRGPVDSDIALTIQRAGEDKPLEIVITRAIIKIRSVRTRVEGNDVIVMRISSFSERTSQDLTRLVGELSAKHGDTLQGAVLDLRNNPGGLLEQAVSVSDAFLDRGEIVSTRGRRPDSIQRFNAREGDVLNGLPLIVLINGGSASASEIVAGALKDHRRAIILGTRSFGKGSVQTVIPMGGHGAMRLTTARYYTPSGTSIQATGIEPDIIVQQARIETIEVGRRRREADLRGRLDNDNESNGTDQEDASDKGIDPSSDGDSEAKKQSDDYQLARALDLLRGLGLLSRTMVN